MMVKKSKSFSKDVLPEDVLIEIFGRLPIKSICKFRCLSKVWLSNLSDTNLMLNKFKTLEKPWAIFSNNHMSTQFISSCRELSGYDGFSFSFLSELHGISAEHHKLYVLASSNGLVLCSAGAESYFVCNPITKESVSLPPPPKNIDGKFSYGLVCDTGITCESAFKVVRTQTSLRSSTSLEVEIYFSDLDEWRTYDVAYLEPREYTRKNESKSNVITHNGIVYWIEDHKTNRVVAYDLKINNYECECHQCDVYDVPILYRHLRRARASSECIGVSEDIVRYGHIRNDVLRVWDEDCLDHGDDYYAYDEEFGWDRIHEIDLTDMFPDEFWLMAFSPTDCHVVILACGDQFFAFDLTTEEEPELLHSLCARSSKVYLNQHEKSEILHSLFLPLRKNRAYSQQPYTVVVTPSLTAISKPRR